MRDDSSSNLRTKKLLLTMQVSLKHLSSHQVCAYTRACACLCTYARGYFEDVLMMMMTTITTMAITTTMTKTTIICRFRQTYDMAATLLHGLESELHPTHQRAHTHTKCARAPKGVWYAYISTHRKTLPVFAHVLTHRKNGILVDRD